MTTIRHGERWTYRFPEMMTGEQADALCSPLVAFNAEPPAITVIYSEHGRYFPATRNEPAEFLEREITGYELDGKRLNPIQAALIRLHFEAEIQEALDAAEIESPPLFAKAEFAGDAP